jgi:hypothetical protein
LAYDGVDDTIWVSPDAYTTIYHYSNAGVLLASFPLGSLLGGNGNSGIAVGGSALYLGNDGGSQIYQCDKGLAACTLMSTFPARIEDLECDNVTFPGKNAIWSQDAYDRIMNAWEIPNGTCGIGGSSGGGATPSATVRLKTHTPTVTPTSTETPTSVPVTDTPVPPTVAPPSATPIGGTEGIIRGPDTGDGATTGRDASLKLVWAGLLMLIAGGAVAATAMKARR